MSIQNRQFQIDTVDHTYKKLLEERVWCMQGATGSGKTVMFCKIAQRYVRQFNKSVLILVNRKELLGQAYDTVKEITGITPYIINAETKRYAIARVYIGMVESLIARTNLFDNVGLVIIDECHIANFNKVIPMFMEELILGCTATPLATSKLMPIKRFYNGITLGPQIETLIGMGYLSQNVTRCPKDIVDASEFKVDRMSDDYNVAQMSAAYQVQKHVINVVKEYRIFCKREKTIVFNVSIEHSNNVAECFREMGYNCRHLGSDNEHERDEILKWFKETKDAILCNVMIATVGFDEPSVRNIILNFSTLSLVKYIQCCGRGSRVMDEIFIKENQWKYPYQLETKDYFNIIDMGGNSATNKFGDWNQDRDWEYIFYHPPQPGEGIAPVKTCPQCQGLLHAAARQCNLKLPNGDLCLHEFKKIQMEEQDIEEMIMITKGINVDEITTKYRKKYEYYPMLALGEHVVERMCKSNSNLTDDIVNRYFKMYYELCCEWYDKFLAGKEYRLDTIEDSAFHIKLATNNFGNLCKRFTGNIITPTKFYDWKSETKDEKPTGILTVDEYRQKYLGHEKTA